MISRPSNSSFFGCATDSEKYEIQKPYRQLQLSCTCTHKREAMPHSVAIVLPVFAPSHSPFGQQQPLINLQACLYFLLTHRVNFPRDGNQRQELCENHPSHSYCHFLYHCLNSNLWKSSTAPSTVLDSQLISAIQHSSGWALQPVTLSLDLNSATLSSVAVGNVKPSQCICPHTSKMEVVRLPTT